VEQHQNHGRALRVVVVGAGIVGGSIAYHLSRRQVAVTVLERHQPGAGASSHSFAWLNAFGKDPVAYHDLNRRSMEGWYRFARDLEADIGLYWGGELRWVTTLEGAKALHERIQQLQTWGYPSRLITAEELLRLEPGLVPGAVSAASLGMIDGQVEPLKVIDACLRQAQARGAVVHAQDAGKRIRPGTHARHPAPCPGGTDPAGGDRLRCGSARRWYRHHRPRRHGRTARSPAREPWGSHPY
jgi:glycine/D-amino acid oxidase-like deaminating enzyme